MMFIQNIWIAPLIGESEDSFENLIRTYDKPFLIKGVKVNSVSSHKEFLEFGTKAQHMAKVFLNMNSYFGKLKIGDKAYLYGAQPSNEVEIGSKANYRVCTVRPQGVKILVYFESIE